MAENVERTGPSAVLVAVLLAAHVPLALAMNASPAVATVHALGTLLVGLWATGAGRDSAATAIVAAYIAGAEVVWRVTEARVFWEYGKYATVAVLALTCFRTGLRRRAALPALYLALLVPAALLTASQPSDWRTIRGQLSFNLSGPLALAACAWFFAQTRLQAGDIRRLLLALIAPSIGMAAIMVFNILTNPDIKFSSDSNMAVTGGFGPNQVSATLGLAALAALFLILDERCSRAIRATAVVCLVFLATQSAMTFSRGGLYNAAAGFLVAVFFLCRDAQSRVRVLAVTVLLMLTAHYFIIPRVDALTGGAFLTRFRDINPSGRDELLQADLDIWREHPVLGVGAGLAVVSREGMVSGASGAHTEFSRLLSEHGLLGLMATICLITAAARNIRAGGSPRQRAFVGSLTVWSFAFMLHAAMRLVAPAFAYGLGFAVIGDREAPVTVRAPRRPHRVARIAPARRRLTAAALNPAR
jgi:hypothetical protein